jgi:CRISPR/Cas system-associated endonuclease/helicase Cas3
MKNLSNISQELKTLSSNELLKRLEDKAGVVRFYVFEELANRVNSEPDILKSLKTALLSKSNKELRYRGSTSISHLAMLALLRTKSDLAQQVVADVLEQMDGEDQRHFQWLIAQEHLDMPVLAVA